MIMADGTELPLRRWGPAPERNEKPAAVVVGIHGFNDHAGSFISTAKALNQHGIALYSWDQRGFGASTTRPEWPGTEVLVKDARFALEALRARYPDQSLYLMGLSMGGAIAALMLEEDAATQQLAGVILVGPAVWARSKMPWYQQGALWVGERTAPDMKLASRTFGIDPTDDPAVLEQIIKDPLRISDTRVDAIGGISKLMDQALSALQKLPALPTLVLYGGEDEVIPHEAACEMFRALPASDAWRAVYYPDGYHMLTRYTGSPAVLSDIIAFVQNADADLPSGREVTRDQAISRLCE
ncbi:MAG: lysophospholipase [Gammaproteobacteria bacterium]|nr:lysophospholipase [Gammaproteobacteria bacterium]